MNVQNDGDIITWEVVVTNTLSHSCSNVKATFTIPSGLAINGPFIDGSTAIDVPKGVFQVSDLWHIGTMAAAEVQTLSLEIIVTDITLVDPIDNRFVLSVAITTGCSETLTEDNVVAVIIEIGEETSNEVCVGSSSENIFTDLSIG